MLVLLYGVEGRLARGIGRVILWVFWVGTISVI